MRVVLNVIELSQRHTLSIMFFIFGIILLIGGMGLFSITETVRHYETIYGFQVPTGWDTIHPYVGFAGLLAAAGLCIIVVAIINVIAIEKRTEMEKGLVKLQFCPNCGEKLSGNEKFCSNCGLKFKEVVDDKGKTPSFQTVPEKSPIQIENIKLTRTGGRAFFMLEVRNACDKTATKVEVTPPFGSLTLIDLPEGGLKPHQTTKHTATLVGDYNVGNTYVIVVKAFYNDGTTSSVVVSARCVW
jgi:ribosomal protein L32